MTQQKIHAYIIAFLFTLVNWTIVNNLIVEINIIKWIFIELLLGFSLRLYNFTLTKITK